MSKLLNKLLSMKVAVIFLFFFGMASGVATFIENDFGVSASWSSVYNSTWFEIVQIVLVLTIINNIFKYKLIQKDKLPSLMFHVGFIVILLGAGVTRYAGYEGSLHIREGKSENRLISSDVFVKASAQKDAKVYSSRVKKILSAVGPNYFNFDLNIDGKTANITYKDFIHNAVYEIVEATDGKPMISMMLSNQGQATKATLQEGDVREDENYIFTFNTSAKKNSQKPVIAFYTKGDKIFLKSPKEIKWFKMVENTRGTYKANEEVEFTTGQLYTIGTTNFAPKYVGFNGKQKLISNPNIQNQRMAMSAVIVEVEYEGETKEIELMGRGKGSLGLKKVFSMKNQEFVMSWGSDILELPFSLKLNDFQLDRYPGSNSPMSYASEVEVVDKKNGVNMPYRIYMNHVLDYAGYRFFQSSYDQDEKGTILSVNSDPGKWPTYLGYFLLSLGLILNVINPKSRFRKLSNMITRDTKRVSSFILALACSVVLLGTGNLQADTLKTLSSYDKAHADKFGEILAQSADGRIKPIDTIADEVLNKIYRKTNYKGISANQVILGMMTYPQGWQVQKMIKVFHPELKKLIGMTEKEKYASFNMFFKKDGSFEYKLAQYAEDASRKKPAHRNKFDKDVIKVDERVNVAYMAYTGEIFRIIPKIGDENYTWYSPKAAISRFPAEESQYVRGLLASYFDAIKKGLEKNQWEDANKLVDQIKAYQEHYAKDIMPSPSRINAEILFNKAKIFQRLTPLYLISGFVLLLFIFAKMVKPKLKIQRVTKIVFGINMIAFVIHTFGLGLRWYISGHAPWSDGYESMIYIAWALALSGIFFSKQSIVSLALTGILAGVTLFVAHLSWMDAQITTLVPVLKSYWLNIHVSVITASYGFLGLCSLLGFFTLILFILRKKGVQSKRNEEIERNIVEATRINEMSMVLGLSLLTIGNFLGGVWANESWGRYWGWDPKETWALVSILIYAAVVHFRFIPSLNNQFSFAVASTVSFASIIMTYFGVNFYLSGMHSYASGDPVPIPMFVYYTVAIVFTVIAIAFPKRDISKTL